MTTSYGSFGSSNAAADLAYGGKNWGNFISVNALNTGRFLDVPEFTVQHDKGNEENLFDRVDLQILAPTPFTLISATLAAGSRRPTPSTPNGRRPGVGWTEFFHKWKIMVGWLPTVSPLDQPISAPRLARSTSHLLGRACWIRTPYLH